MDYKTIWLLRRNPAITREQFIDHYERVHSKFIRNLSGVTKYVRRYTVRPDYATEYTPDTLRYDVIMETWFESKAARDASFEHLKSTGLMDSVQQDEEYLFDRANPGWAVALIADIEHETDLKSPTFETTYEVERHA